MPVAPLSSADWWMSYAQSVVAGNRLLGSSLSSKIPDLAATLRRLEDSGLTVGKRASRSLIDGHEEVEYVWALDPRTVFVYFQAQDKARHVGTSKALRAFWAESGKLYGYRPSDVADFDSWVAPGGSFDPVKCPCPCVQCRPDLFVLK